MALDTSPQANTDATCLKCFQPFTRKRKDQRYCGRTCQKAATSHAARGDRSLENGARAAQHHERAVWLSYDLNRMNPKARVEAILAILEAASGGDAALRNILLDPAFLGAPAGSPLGKLYPDTKCLTSLNIAKMVNVFCRTAYGCGVRDAILDDGKPAGRKFIGDDFTCSAANFPDPAPPVLPAIETAGETLTLSLMALANLYASRGIDINDAPDIPTAKRKPLPSDGEVRARFLKRNGYPMPDPEEDFRRVDAAVIASQAAVNRLSPMPEAPALPAVEPLPRPSGFDWRHIARVMGDRGWKRYCSQIELDRLL